jgi:hypothetical protein
MKLFAIIIFITKLFLLCSCSKHISLFMAGDSMMSIKKKSAFPETGWGMSFENFCDKKMKIINYAENGRSTKVLEKLENGWVAFSTKIM